MVYALYVFAGSIAVTIAIIASVALWSLRRPATQQQHALAVIKLLTDVLRTLVQRH
jgi:hypothetical protein